MVDFLTINDEGQLSFSPDGTDDNTVVTEENYLEVLPDSFYCSSSIDFPNEFTDDQKVIDLIRKIRDTPPICPPIRDVES